MVSERYSVDRVVSDIAVLVSDTGREITLSAEEYGLNTNDIVDITFDGDVPVKVERCDGEKEKRLAKNRERLASLFKNKKKN